MKYTNTIISLIALFDSAFLLKAETSYVASEVPVTIVCTTKILTPAIQDVNPETGKPDVKLSLVESASWTEYDKNSNAVTDNTVSGLKYLTYKIDNASILKELATNGTIQSIKGYSITASFNGDSFAIHASSRFDSVDLSLTISLNDTNAAYTIKDVTKYSKNGDVQKLIHNGTSTIENIATVTNDFLEAKGYLTGSTFDFTWLSDVKNPDSLQKITIPGKFNISGIVGTYNAQDVNDNTITGVVSGSISFANSRAVKNE